MELIVFDKQKTKEYLLETISKNKDFDYFVNTTDGARNLDLIVDLISSSVEISNVYSQRSYQESRVDNAIFEENIVSRAKELGYRIRRKQAPIVSLKYVGETPIQVDYALSFGSIVYNKIEYQLLPFSNKIVEYGDIVPCYVARIIHQTRSVSKVFFESEIIEYINPTEDGLGIDDSNVILLLNSVLQNMSIFPEDYIVKQQVSNYSDSKTIAKIFIADLTKKFGIYNLFSANNRNIIDIFALETCGEIPDLDLNNINYNSSVVLPQEIISFGFNEESNDSISYNAPYMYSLMRRAITEADFVYLLKTYQIIKDVSINDYGGVLGVYDFTFNSVEAENYIIINSIVYSYTNNNLGISVQDLYEYLHQELLASELVVPSFIKDVATGNITTLRLTSNNSRSLLSFNTSSNISVVETTKQVPARSCIGYVRYVLTTTTYGNPPEKLTEQEYNQIKATLDYYRPVGLVLFFERAYPVDMQIKFLINIDKNKFNNVFQFTIDEFKQEVSKFIYEEYDKKIGIRVSTQQIIKRLVEYINTKFIANLITSIYDFNEIDILIDRSSYSDINVLLDYSFNG